MTRAVLTLKCQFSPGDAAFHTHQRSGGFDEGWLLVRLHPIGLPFGAARLSPMGVAARFPCQIRRGRGDFFGFCGTVSWLFRASRPVSEASRAGAAAGARLRRPCRRRERPRRAALKPYRCRAC
jgi:hypothetical protein